MKWKKTAAACSVLLGLQLVLSGCWFNNSNNSTVKNSNGKTENASLIPSANDSDYQMLRPKSDSTTRGYIQYGPKNRVDMDQMETGLMDLSKDVFSPNDYVFQMGQYMKNTDINSILYRKGSEPQRAANKSLPKDQQKTVIPGINPALGKGKNIVEQSKNSPKYINYVLEQDYMKRNSKGQYKIAGMSVAVSLNSVYADNINYNGKIYPISEKLNRAKVEGWAKAHAQQIVQRIRDIGKDNKDSSDKTYEDLQKIPIFLTLYVTAEPESYVPGDFVAKTEISAGSSSISKWTSVNEHHVLFPSDNATNSYKGDLDKFNQIKNDVQKYYPNYVGVIGKAFYRNKELSDLTLNINFNKFVDESEMIGFTNYVTSLVEKRLPFERSIPIHIYISTNDIPEALIERTESMDQPYVHIFQH
ncbi:CamS family sex pheromone protein [Sporolactobacillus shoreicorticis]|uniref:CamS family sex pheromone protein n=1 Tax=Sporolactobacillus shoreicorticis TaxID=1923877 RepID=A0ABW5S261_9BACL|nr:CamS family sex pheromone protein [Sporolactobacillus shoreicorticis]MCO7124587.1 CamS family sex pheromone protein [Sporolactobacillus shoreicorticis]